MKPTELHEEPECVEMFTNRYQIWSGATLKCYQLDVVLISQARTCNKAACVYTYFAIVVSVCLCVCRSLLLLQLHVHIYATECKQLSPATKVNFHTQLISTSYVCTSG